MQVLKEEIRNKILEVAENMFFQYGLKGTTMRAIAKNVGISTSNLYLYFENKECIFESLIDNFYQDFFSRMTKFLQHDDRVMPVELELGQILKKIINTDKRKFVILTDNSAGSKYENFKLQIIKALQGHISEYIRRDLVPDSCIPYILARNFVEGVIEIARNYKDTVSFDENLYLLIKYHMKGIEALH